MEVIKPNMEDSMTQEDRSAISQDVNVHQLPRKGRHVCIEPQSEKLLRLAEEHGLVSVDRFRADLLVAPWKRDGVRVTGSVVADIVQSCVVSLEPLPARISQTIDALFVPERSKIGRIREEAGGELLLDPEGDDMPETFSGHTIDIGALCDEFFELELDPYPRKPGVVVEPFESASGAKDAAPSPFQKLAQLKRES